MVQVTNDERDVDKAYPIELAMLGDAKLVLRQLIDEITHQRGTSPPPASDDLTQTVRSTREAFLQEWSPRLTSDETPINPYRVVWDLMHTIDRRQTILTHDSGNPRDQTVPFYEALVPRGYIGWGKSTQLGTGLGIALGAKLAHPDKLVVNIMGDLAFGTAGMDVETAVRERIPILTVLLNNSRMGGYRNYLPLASERYGFNRLSGDYATVAAGLGAYTERVERPEEVVPALRRGIAATGEGRPAVLEMITKEEPVYPVSARRGR
jgi:acetolactate synthase-1/2/3 large subunit